MKIVCVGECTLDNYLNLEPGVNTRYVGGISLNFAVHSKRYGLEQVSLISAVGADEAGRSVLHRLAQEGVDASMVRVLPGKTAQQDIRLVEGGERIFPPGGFHIGVLADYRLDGGDFDVIRRHDVLVAPLYAQLEPLFKQAMLEPDFSGKRVADFLDGSDYSDIVTRIGAYQEALDIVFVSGTKETVQALMPLSRAYAGVIVVTLGALGSVALEGGTPVYQAAIQGVKPVDTTGCGDAFQAAFTVTYFQSGHVEKALRQGARRAATVLGHVGAIG